MPREANAALQLKILQIAFVLVFVAAILYGVRGMMIGSSFVVKMFSLVLIGGAIVIALDDRYWLFPAFLFGFYDTLPVVKFTGAELGSIVLFATFFVRLALRRDVFVVGSKRLVWAAVPFLAWMCLVWSMNPVGMNIFGSSSIGGRFYLKVVLAFLSLFVLSCLEFDDRGCRFLCFSIAAGYLVFVARLALFGGNDEMSLGSYTHYEFLHMSFVVPFFLCRFSAPELLVRFWPFMGFFTMFALSLYSGNRTAAARPVLVGLMAPLFLRKDRIKTLVLLVFAGLGLAVLVAGHGVVWHLPYSIQRSLSFLPGRWERRLESYGFNDDFRAELRYWARQHIKERPWFGDGGFSLDHTDMVWSNALAQRGGFEATIAGHVLARNWHNVWLGMAADFGIPLSVFWGLFMAVLLWEGYRGTKKLPPGSWWQTAYLYFYLLILTESVNFFFNGGHTSLTAQQLFLWAGMMTAVLNGVHGTNQGLSGSSVPSLSPPSPTKTP